MKTAFLGLAALASAALAVPAPATIIQKSFPFHAAVGGPTPSHTGSFAFAYDDITGEAALTMIDFAIGMTPFNLFNASVTAHGFHWSRPQFILGGVSPGRPENVIEHGTDDFWLIFQPDTGTASHFAYSQVGTGYHAGDGISLTAAEVPEPSAVFLLAPALLLAALRRRRRSPAPI
jgi:hypothetical protein